MRELLEAAIYATALQESESRSAWSLRGASAPGGELTSTLLSKNNLQTEGEELTEHLIWSHSLTEKEKKKQSGGFSLKINGSLLQGCQMFICCDWLKQVDRSLAFESTDSIKINNWRIKELFFFTRCTGWSQTDTDLCCRVLIRIVLQYRWCVWFRCVIVSQCLGGKDELRLLWT